MRTQLSGPMGRSLVLVVAVLMALVGSLLVVHALRAPAPPSSPSAAASLPADEGEPSTVPTPSTPGPGPASGSGAAAPKATKGPVISRSRPVRLDAPAISMSREPLTSYGLDADGVVAIPPADLQTPAGWLDRSPTPGEIGPSVIVGHVDSQKAGPSVFYRLGQLKPGDTVSVTRADGIVAVFRVEGVEQYHKAEFPTLKVYGNLDHAGLRLITCGGKFDRSVGHYEDNIVVYARLMSSHRA